MCQKSEVEREREKYQDLYILEGSWFCTSFTFYLVGYVGVGVCCSFDSKDIILNLTVSKPIELVLSPYDQYMILKVSKPSG